MKTSMPGYRNKRTIYTGYSRIAITRKGEKVTIITSGFSKDQLLKIVKGMSPYC